MISPSSAEARAIAVVAEAHPKTIVRRILGLPTKGLTAIRVDRALAAAGWVPVMIDGSVTGWTREA